MNTEEKQDNEQILTSCAPLNRTKIIIGCIIVFCILCLIFVNFPQIEILYYVTLSWLTYLLIVTLVIINMRENKISLGEFYFWVFIMLGVGFVITLIAIPQLLGSRRHAWENRCKLALRTLGSAQIDFADNHDGNYGTWQELVDEGLLQKGYNPTNIIDNYSILVFSVKNVTQTDQLDSNIISSFTIVAVPVNERNRLFKPAVYITMRKGFPGINVFIKNLPGWLLRIFALGEDQTPRVWVGKDSEWTTENISLHNNELWEPLR